VTPPAARAGATRSRTGRRRDGGWPGRNDLRDRGRRGPRVLAGHTHPRCGPASRSAASRTRVLCGKKFRLPVTCASLRGLSGPARNVRTPPVSRRDGHARAPIYTPAPIEQRRPARQPRLRPRRETDVAAISWNVLFPGAGARYAALESSTRRSDPRLASTRSRASALLSVACWAPRSGCHSLGPARLAQCRRVPGRAGSTASATQNASARRGTAGGDGPFGSTSVRGVRAHDVLDRTRGKKGPKADTKTIPRAILP
jgi:hypothetical protein